MFSLFGKKNKKLSIAVVDGSFPQKKPMGFRNAEINGLMEKIEDFKCYTMYPMKPGKEAWFKHKYGIKPKKFKENITGYLEIYPQNKDKIKYLSKFRKYSFLGYSYFLAETYTLLPFFEKNKIPFVFVLYPGGGFGLNNDSSDKMLEKIFESPFFRKVIVTQDVTERYLLEKSFCKKEQISFLPISHLQFSKEEILPKKLYKKDKDTFDICFVAAKYSPKGVDKGYDLFIDSAKIFTKKYPDTHFHVVGGFDENEIDISDIKENIHFYGYQQPSFLKQFYSGMDICLSPNRPYKLYDGNFDGFPLGFESMSAEVLLMTTDELDNKGNHFNDDELVVIKPNLEDILSKLELYYNNLKELYDMSKKGQKKIFEICDPSVRIDTAVNILENELKKEIASNE